MSTYDGSKVWLLVRDGKIKLRIPPSSKPFIRDGKLWVKTPQNGECAVVDGELAKRDGVIDQVTAAVKAFDYKSIDPKYLAGPGASESGLLVITADEWAERERTEAAKSMWGRELKVNKAGKPVLQHDVRDQLDAEVVVLGYRWKVDGLGQPFDYGHAHKTRYAYLTLIGPAGSSYTAYRKLLELADEENRRWHDQFNAMMDDENNDGVNPPRGEAELFRNLAEQMEAANPRLKLERKVQAQADESPETTMGYLRGQAGKRALNLLREGADESAVIAELESYKSDPSYIDAAWG